MLSHPLLPKLRALKLSAMALTLDTRSRQAVALFWVIALALFSVDKHRIGKMGGASFAANRGPEHFQAMGHKGGRKLSDLVKLAIGLLSSVASFWPLLAVAAIPAFVYLFGESPRKP